MTGVADALVENKRAVEALQQRAAERAGMRFLMFDDARALGPDGVAYAREYAERLVEDLADELVAAAAAGKRLLEAIGEQTP